MLVLGEWAVCVCVCPARVVWHWMAAAAVVKDGLRQVESGLEKSRGHVSPGVRIGSNGRWCITSVFGMR